MSSTVAQEKQDRWWFATVIPTAVGVTLWWWLVTDDAVWLPLPLGLLIGFFTQLSDDDRVRWFGRGIGLGVVLPFTVGLIYVATSSGSS